MTIKAPPVLYSFRRCPYAIRARMALLTSHTCVELREIILRDKPQDMIMASPKATVPVLILTDGTVIDESLDIMLWALAQNDPQGWLDGKHLNAMLDLIQLCEDEFKWHLDRYKYATRYEGADPLTHRADACIFLNTLEHMLEESPFLFGDSPLLADMAIAPFVRQFSNTDRQWFDICSYKRVRKWVIAFMESPVFLSVMKKYPLWVKDADKIFFGA